MKFFKKLFNKGSSSEESREQIEQQTADQLEEGEKEDVSEMLEDCSESCLDVDGWRAWKFRPDGYYLAVFPAQGKGRKLTFDDLEGEITELKEDLIDLEKVNLMVNKAEGKYERIFDVANNESVDGKILIWFSQDEVEAYLSIFPPIRSGKVVLKEDVEKRIEQLKIDKELLVDKAISEAIEAPGEKIVLAKGRYPKEGKDAEVVYKFSINKDIKPKMLKNGTVDYLELDIIQNIIEGTVLAEKIPLQPSENGVNVQGKVIELPKSKDINLPKGKNTKIEGNKLIAGASGHPVFKNSKVEILPLINIKGDVCLETGNISNEGEPFEGSLNIAGSINEGFKVIAAGDVKVNKNNFGKIVAGGSVYIGQGVISGEVIAGGSVYAKFVENGKIEAEGSIRVANTILHSDVLSEDTIIVSDKGVIVGGKVRATKKIEAKTIGASMGTRTFIEVGTSPKTRDAYEETISLIEKNNKLLEKINITLRTNPRHLTPKNKNLLEIKRKNILKEIEELDNKRKILYKKIIRPKGQVLASIINPGVFVNIGTAKKSIKKELRAVNLTYKDGEINY